MQHDIEGSRVGGGPLGGDDEGHRFATEKAVDGVRGAPVEGADARKRKAAGRR